MPNVRVLAQISFSGEDAGRWQCNAHDALMAHITMVGQIWLDHFVPAIAPNAMIESAGVAVSAERVRALICRGWRPGRPLRVYRSGRKASREWNGQERRRESRYEVAAPSGSFTLPKLEEAANAAHCGGPSCGYGFECLCSCDHCGGARKREL